jgi:hypothetical protein
MEMRRRRKEELNEEFEKGTPMILRKSEPKGSP